MSAVPQSKSELFATVYTSTDLAMHLLKQAVNREQIGENALMFGAAFQIVIVDGAPMLTNWFVPNIEDGAALLGQLDTFGIHNTGVSSHPPDIQQSNGVVTIFGAAPTVQVVIERSWDLLTWLPVQTNAFPMDKALQTTLDGPCSNAFFRVVKH